MSELECLAYRQLKFQESALDASTFLSFLLSSLFIYFSFAAGPRGRRDVCVGVKTRSGERGKVIGLSFCSLI